MRAARIVVPAAVLAAAAIVIIAWRSNLAGTALPDPPLPGAEHRLDPLCADAVQDALAATRRQPRSAALRARLGMVYDANGLETLAIEAYRQALAVASDQPRWWYHLARSQAALGRYDDAVASMSRAAKLAPEHAPAHWQIGFWQIRLGNLEAAETAFRTAAAIAPEQPAADIGIARVHLISSRPEQAIGMLEPWLPRVSDPSYLHQLMGTACQQLQRLPEAAAHLRLASGTPPAWDEPWNDEVSSLRAGFVPTLERADALAAAGRFDDALRLLEELRRGRADDATLLAKIGEVQLLAGSDEAEATLRDALRLDDTSVPAHLHLARVLRQKRDLDGAARHADRAIELYPTLGHAHHGRAMVELIAERWANAETRLVQAIRYGVTDAETRTNLALARYRLGRLDSALQPLDLVLEREPDNLRALLLAAVISADLGHAEQAGRLVRRAASAAPQDPGVAETTRYVQQRIGGGP